MRNLAKNYLDRQRFFMDTVNYRVFPIEQVNTSGSEACPVAISGHFFCVVKKGKAVRALQPSDDPARQQVKAYALLDSLGFSETKIYDNLQNIPLYSQFCFSPDARHFYFCRPVSNTEMNVKSPFPFTRYQLFILDVGTLNEKSPTIKPFLHNSALYNVMHPSISADGRRLFFASDMKGSFGGKDIYMCRWENNDWSVPENLGASVNSPGNEIYPYAADNGHLYFSSDHFAGLGGLDIFRSEMFADSTGYHGAQNIGAPFNSRYDDFGIFFLKGFQKGYLSSTRAGNGDDDIFFFSGRE
jgi:hypothetical protein